MCISKGMKVGVVMLACVALIIGAGGCSRTAVPTVLSTVPADGATDMPVNTKIAITFGKEMDPETITTETFTLIRGTTPVAGSMNSVNDTTTFTPTDDLMPNTLYTATVMAGVESLNQLQKCGQSSDTKSWAKALLEGFGVAGNKCNNALEEDFVWTFTTGIFSEGEGEPAEGEIEGEGEGETEGEGEGEGETVEGEIEGEGEGEGETVEGEIEGEGVDQEPVELGATNTFAILAGSTVENTGNSIVTGNLGVSPGSDVIGFPPGTVSGEVYIGVDSAAGQAKLDLTNAFLDAAGRSTDTVSLPGNLSGLTLYPGLYTNSTSVMLSAGNVTLDAQGDANAVFIFQMGSTLTTGSATEVVLSGGAKAANIYWQVGSSATLGTTSIFKGNILAQESITLATGATLEGRALTQTAAVTLDASIITVPAS